MIRRGDIVLGRFPFTDLTGIKLRPILILAATAGTHRDFLAMFISSQLHQAEPGVDVILDATNSAFTRSGLKTPSVFKVTKVATLSESLLLGPIGHLDQRMFDDLVDRLTDWLRSGRPVISQ
jgi:mRNA interferase MazF